MLRLVGGAVAAFGFACVAAASPQTRLAPWEGGAKPPLELDSLGSGRVALGDHAGTAVLVHFFATWCEPCVEEMASLERLAERRSGEALVVLAVDVREVDARVRRFFDERPVSFPVLLDRDGAVTRAWQVVALPSSYVLDSDLSPVLFSGRDVDWDHPDVNAALDEVIRASTAAGVQHATREEEK